MMYPIRVSTPSRICLFGEHLDYLGLEVVALAINLRFCASISPREDQQIHISIRDERLGSLGSDGTEYPPQEYWIDLSKPIVYQHKRDYMNSCVNLLLKEGYLNPQQGYDISLDAKIPIGKGMCSSTTMIMVILRALLEASGAPVKEDLSELAYLGYRAEVEEFHEPGGMMDHYTSAYGGLVHLDFAGGTVKPTRLDAEIPGYFVLFDSLCDKDTIRVLSQAKQPVMEALEQLKPYGVEGIRDLYQNPSKLELLKHLDEWHRKKLQASYDNYVILREALRFFEKGQFLPAGFGQMIYRHHKNLRDGFGISTPTIERILDTAMEHGALGGKINGSGGGGCCYVYCPDRESAERVLDAVQAIGFPGMMLQPDQGNRVDPD